MSQQPEQRPQSLLEAFRDRKVIMAASALAVVTACAPANSKDHLPEKADSSIYLTEDMEDTEGGEIDPESGKPQSFVDERDTVAGARERARFGDHDYDGISNAEDPDVKLFSATKTEQINGQVGPEDEIIVGEADSAVPSDMRQAGNPENGVVNYFVDSTPD